jgi:hypothetical protein
MLPLLPRTQRIRMAVPERMSPRATGHVSMSMGTMYSTKPPVWTARARWWRDLRWIGRLGALSTLLALLTLLTVSGPHLVHHLTEQPPHEHHHSSDHPRTPEHDPPPRPDCLVLFLMQHMPVAEAGDTLLPTLLLATESLRVPRLLWQTDTPRYAVQARGPPLMFL